MNQPNSPDITERRRAGEALRQSEERYRSLVVATAQIVWTTDPQGVVIDIPDWRAFTGQTVEEVKGWGWTHALHPEDRERTAAVWTQAVATRSIYDTEYRVRGRDGQYRYFAARGVPVLNADGSIREWVGTCTDITERKRAEQTLALQARIAAIFLTIPDDEMFNEVLKAILDVMRSPFGVFGYLDEAGALVVPTMTRQIWDKCQVPDKTLVFPRATWGESSWPRAIREKQANYSNEVSIKAPAGHVTVTRHISLPIVFQGEVIGLFQVANKETDFTEADVRTLEDIAGQIAPLLSARLRRERAQEALQDEVAERKRAQESLALQARIANVFLTIADDEMFNEVLKVVLDVMRSPFGVFGYIDEAGAFVVPTMTRQIWDKCQVPDKTFVFPRATWGDSSWPRAIREKKANYSNEVSTKAPLGHVTITRHISLPVLFQGEVIGLFQVANKETDFTEADVRTLEDIAGQIAPLLSARLRRERAQVALRKLNDELEQRVLERTAQLEAANKELEAFSYSVSHDLRAPLRAVDGFANVLVEDYAKKLDAEGRRVIGVIRAEAQRMGELIDDLLAFSRLSRQPMQLTEVDLNALAQAVYERGAAREPDRRIEFKLHPLPSVQADAAMLRQVLANLLSNAVKFTRPREVAAIEIGVMESRSDGVMGTAQDAAVPQSEHSSIPPLQPSIVFFVRDNGVGFDMKYAEKLFGVFQRLHTMEEFEGTGVGLALVQRVIHRHGGRVWAEGKVNEGATFYFSLPNMKGKL